MVGCPGNNELGMVFFSSAFAAYGNDYAALSPVVDVRLL